MGGRYVYEGCGASFFGGPFLKSVSMTVGGGMPISLLYISFFGGPPMFFAAAAAAASLHSNGLGSNL